MCIQDKVVTNVRQNETYALFACLCVITLKAQKIRPSTEVIVTSRAHQQQWQFQTRYYKDIAKNYIIILLQRQRGRR